MTVIFLSQEQREALARKPTPVAPGEQREPGNVLVLSVAGRAAGVVFKVKAWDPKRHPRGYKGLFISTPDKLNAGDAKPGDVIATKSGKVFRVEGHGAKGIKVSSVDPDTGEVLQKGTVVANGIEVARIEGGKSIGTRHQIGSLDPGTFIQHPRSGKRFVVSKHGNWTTVYPVDDQGERAGKHTVLPKDMEVQIAPKATSGQVTPAAAAQIKQAQTAAATAASPSQPRTGDKAPPVLESAAAARDRGEPHIKPSAGQQGAATLARLQQLASEGWVEDNGDGTFTITENGYLWVKNGTQPQKEVMPQNLRQPPSPYAPGVGKNTAIVIEEIPVDYKYQSYRSGSQTYGTQYRVSRVADPSNPSGLGEVIGTYSQVGQARKAARQFGAAHEAIIEAQSVGKGLDQIKQGDWFIKGDVLYHAAGDVLHASGYYGDYLRVPTRGGAYINLSDRTTIRVHDPEKVFQVLHAKGLVPSATPDPTFTSTDLSPNTQPSAFGDVMDVVVDAATKHDPKEIRKARPNLYVEALRHDFDPSDLVGKSKGDGLAALRKLGFAEITPREPNMTKYVDARGRRLHIHNKGGVVTAIDEIKYVTPKSMQGVAGFHRQLQAVLDSGGDVRAMNPQNSNNPEEKTAHARQLVFDMALGKQNGVEKLFQTAAGGTVKVKSDTAYHREIEQDTAWMAAHGPDAQKKNVADPGVNAPVLAKVMNDHWGQPLSGGNFAHIKADTEDEVAAAIAAGERNGVAQTLKDAGASTFEEATGLLSDAWQEWKQGDTSAFETITQDAGTRDYLVSTLTDISPRARRQLDLRQHEIDRRATALYEQARTDETSTRRKAEGTVAVVPGQSDTFELPLWDDIKLEKQDLYEVESLVQNAQTVDQVPIFATGGILKDSVIYAHKDPNNAPSSASAVFRFDAKVPLEFDRTALQRLPGARRERNSKAPTPQTWTAGNVVDAGTMHVLDEGNGKRIEYVPHSDGQQAATNQRGRLTLEGYTTTEAMQRLKDLGIIHDVEEEAPFEAIFRAKRRFGIVTPLHSDYVSGDAPLPKIPSAIAHGMSSSNAEAVFNSGGLLPIAERFKVGIPLTGTIPANDVRNGVDHVVFGSMAVSGSPYGDVNVIYKDSAYLRRDVLITDRAFGVVPGDRYPQYRHYHNKHRKAAGEQADQNIYEVLSPKVRQSHIDERLRAVSGDPNRLNTGNNEWNLAGGVAIEDMAALFTYDQRSADRLNGVLDKLMREGRISERPQVVVGSRGNSIEQLTARKR